MNRLTRWSLLLFGIAGLALIIGWTIWFTQPPSIILDDCEIEMVTAEVFNADGLTKAVPATNIPAEYIQTLLDVLRPVARHEYPHQWDEASTIGKLTIKKQDGAVIEVTFPSAGQNPLCFTWNGIRCERGGKYEPVVDIVNEGVRFGYGDESIMLVNVIHEIHQEQVSGKKSERLAELWKDFERSAGKRPPRPPR